MNYLGADLSYGSTGLCLIKDVFDGTVLKGHSAPQFWALPKQTMTTGHAMVIAHQVCDFALANEADVVVIEGPSHASRYHGHQMGELQGITKYVLDEANLPYRVVPPSTWMKVCTGKGAGSKETLHHEIYKRFGVEHAIGDCVDAWGVAYTYWLRQQPPDAWKAYQAAAFKNWSGLVNP